MIFIIYIEVEVLYVPSIYFFLFWSVLRYFCFGFIYITFWFYYTALLLKHLCHFSPIQK